MYFEKVGFRLRKLQVNILHPKWKIVLITGNKVKPPSLCPHLLWALQPLLQLQAQLVGWQPELSAYPLWSCHSWPQPHTCCPTRECPSGGSKHQTLWPHCGQLWRKLSLWSWCKLGRVGGEFRVHGHWAGSGLLGWEVLAQRVKTATLGRGRQKTGQRDINGVFLYYEHLIANVLPLSEWWIFVLDMLMTDLTVLSLLGITLFVTMNEMKHKSQWQQFNKLYSEAKLTLKVCGTGVKLGISLKKTNPQKPFFLWKKGFFKIPNPAWWRKYSAQRPREDTNNSTKQLLRLFVDYS